VTTLIVEDGTGLPNSNTYVSIEEAKVYWNDRGFVLHVHEDEEIKNALVRAADFLTYGPHWKGRRLKDEFHDSPQSLAWPRIEVYDEYRLYPSGQIPIEVRRAACEAAFYEAENPHALYPTFVPLERISKVKLGEVEVSYDSSRVDAEAAQPALLAVQRLINKFVDSQPGAVVYSVGSIR